MQKPWGCDIIKQNVQKGASALGLDTRFRKARGSSMDEQYERMEAYLKSKKPGLYVPDSACENASVIVFYSYPAAEDVREGKTVSL